MTSPLPSSRALAVLAGLFLATASTASTADARADNWPNWRGPNQNGSSSEKGFPVKPTKENAAWSTELPGPGASTPAVWDDAVFLTCVDEEQEGVLAIKVDAQSGEIAWSKKFSAGIRQDDRSDYAGPSPVTDGKLVWFFTGNGNLAAFDFEGNPVWNLDIQEKYGPFAFGWTFSTSPVLHGGMLYLQVLQRDVPVDGKGLDHNDSYLLALDPATGEEKWRHIRPSKAVMESREAFTTPVPITHEGRSELLVIGGDALTGHDPATGEELWRWGTWNPEREPFWRLVPSPVYGGSTILACGPKGEPVYAIAAGGEGVLPPADVRWVSEGKEVSADVPTPLFYDGYFYVLNGRNKMLSCVNPGSGDVLWTERIDAKVKLESSPTAADGKIYVMSHLGEVFVYQAGKEAKLLHQAVFGESQSVNIRASIVPANGALYIRTDKALFCVR